MDKNKIIRRLSQIGIFGNILLCAFKLLAGILGRSGAMITDAIHSLSDVAATFIAMVGVKLAKKQEDDSHPYGHERFECVASLILGALLAVTGVTIGWSGLKTLLSGNTASIAVPTLLPLIAALVSIAVKESMFRYTMYWAKKMDSPAFEADAWHHRSDAYSSIGAFIGIGGALLGFPIMDCIAELIICVFILITAVQILVDSFRRLLDTSCSGDMERQIGACILSQSGVLRLDLLKTRLFGNVIYVDVEITVDGALSLREAHEIAEQVHDRVEKEFPSVKHVMIHVNPEEQEEKS